MHEKSGNYSLQCRDRARGRMPAQGRVQLAWAIGGRTNDSKGEGEGSSSMSKCLGAPLNLTFLRFTDEPHISPLYSPRPTTVGFCVLSPPFPYRLQEVERERIWPMERLKCALNVVKFVPFEKWGHLSAFIPGMSSWQIPRLPFTSRLTSGPGCQIEKFNPI